MGMAALQFVASAAVIVIAGTFLTRFADAIADLTGLGRLLIGSVLLAAATSLPELAVDVSAARRGLTNLAVGDLTGSSLFNLLILGVLDLTHHSRGKMLSRLSAAHALSATVSISVTAIVGLAITARSGWEVGGIAPGSIAVLGAYLLGIRLVYCDQQLASKERGEDDAIEVTSAGKLTLWPALAGFGTTALVIILAAPYVAESAGELAELTGLGATFVGNTLVALMTSLPELVTTLAAVRMGAFDLAIGNIFGSNAFNMILLLPVDFFTAEPLLSSVSPTHAVTCFAIIVVTCVAIMGQLYNIERRISFIEPDALLVIVLVLLSLTVIYFLGDQP